jgi:hypothetical protein
VFSDKQEPDLPAFSSSATKLRGVYKHGKNGWRAIICEDGRFRHLGMFPSQELAAEAFAIAAARRAAQKLEKRTVIAARKNKRETRAFLLEMYRKALEAAARGDDTPYGPEVWAEALQHLSASAPSKRGPTP